MNTPGQVRVVGGTYHEESLDPEVRRLWGSGLRAAKILEALGSPVRLTTCIDDSSKTELQTVANVHSLTVDAHARDRSVRYVYQTPLHPAARHGAAAAEPLHAEADFVLGFGMAETTWSISATRAVIDPQHAPAQKLLDATNAERIVLVLNEHELRKTTGLADLFKAARTLLSAGVEAVVIKQGARGGLIVTDGEACPFGVVPTETVEPIGSGDAFTAGFTHAWAVQQLDLFESAAFASRVAGAHSLVGASAFSMAVLAEVGDPVIFASGGIARVYLAAPFFSVGQRAMVRTVRDALRNIGVEVFSPRDEIGIGGDEVAEQDLDGLNGATAVLALLDGADPGTLFETGWATRAGIPVVCLADDPRHHAWTMLRGSGALVVDDLSSAVYRAAWKALENLNKP